MPRLTEYLLRLATDAVALDEFRKHRDARDLESYLNQAFGPGLTPEQAAAVASLDSRRIQEAVNRELGAEKAYTHSTTVDNIHFNFEVNHIQQGGHPPNT